jgi:hypothetical protein
MRTASRNNPITCRPLRVSDGPSESGPRLGGRAPSGVHPGGAKVYGEYLMTIPLIGEANTEISIFLHAVPDDLIHAMNLWNPAGLISAVQHEPRKRGDTSLWRSSLSEHPLIVLPEKVDEMAGYDGAMVPDSCHKLGGLPYVMRAETLADDVARALGDGFGQIVQFDLPALPGDSRAVRGDWPFAGALFHLLGRAPYDGSSWRWFWECG